MRKMEPSAEAFSEKNIDITTRNWQSNLLSQAPNLIHGATTRRYGVLRLGAANRSLVIKNRNRLAQENGFSLDDTVLVKQVHGHRVYEANGKTRKGSAFLDTSLLPEADALVTDSKNTILVIKTADCTPLLLYEPKKQVLAAIHAGWRSTAKDITGQTIQTMINRFSADPSIIRAALGPCIKACHYDVSQTTDNRIELFEKRFSNVVVRNNGNTALDLVKANLQQCLEKGLQRNNIEICPICTYENSQTWASARAGDPSCDFQIWSFIGLKPS